MGSTECPKIPGKWRYSRSDRLDFDGTDDRGELVFIMLNPATTLEKMRENPGKMSHTRRKCRNFAKSQGYGFMTEVNLFAYRASDSTKLFAAAKNDDLVGGSKNDRAIYDAVERADMAVVAWGNGPSQTSGQRATRARADAVIKLIRPLGKRIYCLGTTDSGAPKHPVGASYKDLKPWP